MAKIEERKRPETEEDYFTNQRQNYLSQYAQGTENLEQSRQNQLEETYVNQELLNKYLPENLSKQGLQNSGLAQLYANQANVDYQNTRANINANVDAQQQALQNAYNQNIDALDAQELAYRQQYYDDYAIDFAEKVSEKLTVNNGLNEEDYNYLKDLYTQNRGNIGEYNYNTGISDLEQYRNTEKEIEESEYNKKILAEKIESDVNEIKKIYGNVYQGKSWDAKDMDVSSVGNFAGTGKGTAQDNYVNKVLKLAQKPNTFKNGDVVNFNYGINVGNGYCVYYNGRFYLISGNSRGNASIKSEAPAKGYRFIDYRNIDTL